MFEVKNVSKQYGGEFALSSITMEIGKGMNFIVGASGSGKTTLLKILCGLEQEFDGDAFYCGNSIKALYQVRKVIFTITCLVLYGRSFICLRKRRFWRIFCCLSI